MKTYFQQAPIRNANTIGASVYSHSGEFAPVYTDIQLPGRGLDFKFMRAYRSSHADFVGELGRGWSSSIAKKIELIEGSVLYHDGAGQVYKFTVESNGNYTSPAGFYGILVQEKARFLIHQRYGLTYRFEVPDKSGRITSIEDSNQNTIQFSYSPNKIVISDTLKRKIFISVNNKGVFQELTDHAGRSWKYGYDLENRLITVTQPITSDFPKGTSIKYTYDTDHRLISIIDARGQKCLGNTYNESGKVIAQKHGSGLFKMEYNPAGEGDNNSPIYTTSCIGKNSSKLILKHDRAGNVTERTLYAGKETFEREDTTDLSKDDVQVPLITKSAFNKNSELISLTYPAGNQSQWKYSENDKNVLNQGNLLQFTRIPQAGVENDQKSIVEKYEYEPKFQLITRVIDPRGHKTSYKRDKHGNIILTTYPAVTIQPINSGGARPTPVSIIYKEEYQYNSRGQLLRIKHNDGTITEYAYYPEDDFTGKRGPHAATNNPDTLCGYLAMKVRDANGQRVKTQYAYDMFGNITTVWDGKNNPAHMQYNSMGKLESVTSREPFKNRISYRYDANYNEIESLQSFERLKYDGKKQKTVFKKSNLRELKEYNTLNNLIQRKIVGGTKSITEQFTRDANENIIRLIQPLGNTTEYRYDANDLLIEEKRGIGTNEAFSLSFTYTLNGAVSTCTDGNGKVTLHHYDGFHRYKGFTNSVGTRKTQWFDEADNIVRVVIDGGTGLNSSDGSVKADRVPLMETKYTFDQWNRVYRIDKIWLDSTNGQDPGQSNWNGEKGIVSTVVEYAKNGLPGKTWTESGNVWASEYDGANRIVGLKDLTGEGFSFEYDENNNLILTRYFGPEVQGRRGTRVLRRRFDEMDRLIWQQENEEEPEIIEYNALGNVIKYVGKSGIEIHYTEDAFGRRMGQAFTITDVSNYPTVQKNKIARHFEYDDNYRLMAYTDAAGNRTAYRFDAHDHRTGIVFPNGNVANVEYDAAGNIVSEVDENKNEVNNRYDASNRLVERRMVRKTSGKETIERFEYDGLNRIVSATGPDVTIRRAYDSLSRLLSEQQAEKVIRYEHDSTGNLTSLVYPGGEVVHKTYDLRNRITSAKNKAGQTIASFVYRANDQIARMVLGNVLETDFSYDDKQERLEAIEYRSVDDHKLVEGFRYQYDATGKMVYEINLIEGATYGERYFYDDDNRAIKAQYGVKNVFDPNSSFDQETRYEHFPEGSWKRRIDNDGANRNVDDKTGTINQLNNYKDFGNLTFAYDSNGNCVYKGNSNSGYCTYTYDGDNRLSSSECYDAQGNKTQTIQYFYDALGRQIRKVVTDLKGITTEYTYVWAGTLLLEEYENGVLVRTYIYSSGLQPAQLSVENGGQTDNYYYTHNGKGLASGLVPARDPSRFAEKYGYELTGASFVKEINGVNVAIPSRSSTNSSLANSILSGNYLKDWANSTHSRIGGQHQSPELATMLNSVGKRTNSVREAFNKQANDYLNMIGRGNGNHEKGPSDKGKLSAPPPGVELGSRAMDWSLVSTDPFNPTEDLSEEPLTKAQQADLAAAFEKARLANEAAEARKRLDDNNNKKKDGGTMVNPDSDFSSGAITLLTGQQIEAKLMQNKRPMNPNSGIGSPEIDTSSLPGHRPGGVDPTIALFDGDSAFGGVWENIIVGGGYTDIVRDWEQLNPPVKPGNGGTSPNTGQPLP